MRKHTYLFAFFSMLTSIHERVSVITTYNNQTGAVMPVRMRWQSREYRMHKLGYYHKVRQGRSVHHIFHVTDGTLDFRLKLDSDTLHWILEHVSDGNPS